MSAWIARRARRFWDSGPLGKVLAVSFVPFIAFAAGGVYYGLKSPFASTITGCSLKEDDMNERARVLLSMVEQNYGQSKPIGHGSNRIVYVRAQFDIDYVSTNEPCDSFVSIRVPIQDAIASPVAPNRLLEVLEDPKMGGRYERGPGGSFVYDDDVKAYYLSYTVPMIQLLRGDIVGVIEERLRIGKAWRKAWFEAAGRMALGEEPAPENSVVIPKKAPDRVLPDMNEYITDAGQQRNDREENR